MTSTIQPTPGDAGNEFVCVDASFDSPTFDVEVFASSQRLPTLPGIAIRLVEIAQLEDPDYKEVSRIIRSDPVISGKILKTVNSALFGFRKRVDTIEQAVPKLGISLLRTIILSFHLAQFRGGAKEAQPVLQSLWRSSLTQAVIAELIAEESKSADPPTYFLAGMLQDIGILAMIAEQPRVYLNNVLDRARFPDVASAERACFGLSHVDVSCAILDRWRLGGLFSDAIRHHHDRIVPSPKSQCHRLAVALQAATQGTSILSAKQTKAMFNSELRQWCGFLQTQFDFSIGQTENLVAEINDRVDEYSAMFNFQIGEGVEAERILHEAKAMLQEIALQNQLELIELKSPSRRQKKEQDAIYRDSLSGLYNRAFVSERLSDRVERCIDKGKPLACLFFDVDKFKSINDTYGHAAGDKAIQHVSKWLAQSIRKNDLAIRLGGDEFLLIMQNVKEKQFETIAHRIASQIPPLNLPNGKSIAISLSVGCTFYQPKQGDMIDMNWLIDQSDQSMYLAKKQGGNTISTKKFVGHP